MLLTDASSARVGTAGVGTMALLSGVSQYLHTFATTALGRIFSGAINLIKNGPGILTLSGANTYTGTTSVIGGILSIPATSNLPGFSTSGKVAVASGATLAVGNSVTDAEINTILGAAQFVANSSLGFDTTAGNRTYGTAITGNIGLTKIGPNTLTLSSAGSYTGQTRILEGTLATSAGNILPDATTVDISSGATLQLGGDDTIAAISGAGAVVMGANNLALSGSNTTTHSGIISGTNLITKLGDGTLTLSGNNTFSGGIDFGQYTPSSIDGGTIRVEHNKALGTGQVYFQSAGTIELGTSGLTISNIMNVYNRGSNNARIFTLDLAGTATGTFSGKFDMRKGGTLLKFNVGTDDTLTVSGNITNGSGAGGFEKTGAGTLVLTGAGNNYSGSTVISAGTLQIGAGGTTGSLTTNNNAVTNNGTLVFNRSDNITVANAIGGTGNLIKQASNTLTLSGNNTYTGTTTINLGTITVSKTVSGSTATATFTPTTLAVSFATAPAAGTQNFQFFPGATTQSYSPAFITLTGAPGRSATYDSAISTLIVT